MVTNDVEHVFHRFVCHVVSTFPVCLFKQTRGPWPDVYSQLIMSRIHVQLIQHGAKDGFVLGGRACFQSLPLRGT